jgi:glutathione reductase (NADPH)
MSDTKTYDLIVLGTGGAGYQVATKAKEAGWSVAVVNEGPFGGTCAVRGCIPKKLLSGTADFVDTSRRLGDIGIVSDQPVLDWQKLIEFKKTFTDPVSPGTQASLEEVGIDVYEGSSRFSGNLQLEVNGLELSAKKVHIAVGANPTKLPIEGFEHLITSDDFLDLPNLPKRIVFVGGGYISFEFAHIAARLGADVTILHSDDTPLPIFDKDIINTLIDASKDAGIKIELNSPVQRVEKTENGFVIVSATETHHEADLVVHGAGRSPAVMDLNLEATNVDYDARRGITVDQQLRSTSNPDIYAAGDVANAGPPLSPVAGVQGGIVAKNVLGGGEAQPSYLSTPSVIFTTPTVAMVGLTQDQANESGLEFDVIENDISKWFDSKRVGLKFARSKVLVEKQTQKILGAHLIGNHAEDLINIFSLAIEFGLTTAQLKQPIMAFPSASDDLRSMI